MGECETATAAGRSGRSGAGSPSRNGSTSLTSPPTPAPPPSRSTRSRPATRSRGAAALPDQRLRHRQVPPAHRAGHRPAHAGRLGPLHPGSPSSSNELVEAADDRRLADDRPLRPGRPALHDELGYLELDRRRAELLFQVLTEQEEKPASLSRRTSRPVAGPRPSATRGSAPRSLTGSPSTPHHRDRHRAAYRLAPRQKAPVEHAA